MTHPSTWEDECKALWVENTDLIHALHLAIASPKGVVPRMAERFYQPDHPALREEAKG